MLWREQWFKDQGWQPLPQQRQAWEAIAAGQNGFLELPTGSGKTYAALFGFLPELGNGARGLRLLYIAPLKALTRDIELAIRQPCEAMNLNLRIETRTGDTSASKRRQQKQQLPEILITTPESLALLLTQDNGPALFAELRGVIIDEWHELLTSKRGSLLELSLSRVRSLCPAARTWALSATLPNHEEAALAACGVGSQPLIVAGLPPRTIHMQTLLPSAEDRLPGAGAIGLRVLPQLVEWLDPKFSTLIFTNTRSAAERWHEGLLLLRPEWEPLLALHHGSLDPATRERAETGVKSGAIRFVVCTSSLDLGVDFPEVDRVVQVGSPKSISRLIQRAGRSAHAPGKASELLFVPTQSLELLEISACRRALRAGFIEPRSPLQQPLDVLIQHVVSCALGGGFQADALYHEVRQAYGFRELSRETFDWVLRFVVEGGEVLKAYPQYCRVVMEHDLFLVKDKQIMQRHRQNIGTILSDSSMVVNLGRRRLGTIEESFMARLRKGDTFLYAGRWLEVVSMADLTVYTRLSRRSSDGLIPTWFGQKLPWSPLLSSFMREVVDDLASGSDDEMELQALAAIKQSQEKISVWPQKRELLAEVHQSREGLHFFLFPFEGQAVHESLAVLLVYRMSRLLAASFSVASNDYGLEIVSSISLDWKDLITGLLSVDSMETDLQAALNHTELARRKFRGIARVAGLVHQNLPGRRHSNRQLQSSTGLLFDVFNRFDPGNLLVKQAEVEVLEEQFNREGLRRLLLKMQSMPLLFQTTQTFSPLAFPLYIQRVSAQLSSEQIADRIERIKQAWKQSNGTSTGKKLAFLAEKAVYWPGRGTLMVADLHWGKAEIFQRAGIPVSSQMLSDDLGRLSRLMQETQAERLILLGDLLHGQKGMTPELCQAVAAWRASIPADIVFIRGNHDRKIDCPSAWDMRVINGSYEDGPFRFCHHPETDAARFTFCGHLHPVIHVGPRTDRLRLPCFWLQKRCGVLPSFGSFTGGAPIRPARSDQVLAIAESTVFSLQ